MFFSPVRAGWCLLFGICDLIFGICLLFVFWVLGFVYNWVQDWSDGVLGCWSDAGCWMQVSGFRVLDVGSISEK